MDEKHAESVKNPTPETPDLSETNFETALAELESLVTRMEGGDLSLDDSLKAFERGVLLARHCQTALSEAQLRVQVLTEDGELQPLDGTGEHDG